MTGFEGAPERLRERLLPECRAGTEYRVQSTGYAEVAERLLALAQGGVADHETAMTLLAADGLITYVCEMVAEEAPGELGDVGR